MTEPRRRSALATRLQRTGGVEPGLLDTLETLHYRELAFERGEEIVPRGGGIDDVMSLASGWAMRCRHTADGARQIIHILLPGDAITPDAFVRDHAVLQVVALTDASVRYIRPGDIDAHSAGGASLAMGFWRMSAQEAMVLREQVVRVGRLPAAERIANLFLELLNRLELIGETRDDAFALPLSQEEIADALGLSSVHVSRTLGRLRAGGLLSYDGETVRIHDRARLAERCGFDRAVPAGAGRAPAAPGGG